jgi:hypothetical protein
LEVRIVKRNSMSHYDEVLDEARKKEELIANKYIFELYTVLRDEENLPPEDCRAKIEHDCIDLWSKATIRKFLPNEAKNLKKSKTGKLGAEQRKKSKGREESRVPLIEQTTGGNNIESIDSGARINPAENDSFNEKEEESRRFHTELGQRLEERVLSPELIEAARIISTKDQRINELEELIRTNSDLRVNSELYLPAKSAQEIHDIIDVNRSVGMTETDFILRHDGSHIVAVESLDNSYSASNRATQKVGS